MVHIRRLLALALVMILMSAATAFAAEYDPNHPDRLNTGDLSAQSAIVIEVGTGEAIFEKNADDIRPPASTTKIMTVLLGIMMSEPEDIVTISQTAVTIPEDASNIGLVAGEQLTMGELLRATMVASGQDGSIAIAEHVSGSEQNFVALMNEAAQRFGAVNTHFANSHGYNEENHWSTARDLAIITRVAMENETFREIAAMTTYTLPRNEWRDARRMSTQSRVMMEDGEDNEFYYPPLIGIKTGQHSLAGYCFVGGADKDGVELISVILKSGSRASRWNDTRKLMEYGFSQYVSSSIERIYAEHPKVVDISSYDLEDADLGRLQLNIRKLDPSADDHLVGFAGRTDGWLRTYNMRTNVNFTRRLEAPIEAGEVIGTLIYTPEDPTKQPVEYELTAARSIMRRASLAPSVEEIKAYTDADPNPFPRFSLEFLLLVLAPVLSVVVLSQVLFRLLMRKRKPKVSRKSQRYTTRYYR